MAKQSPRNSSESKSAGPAGRGHLVFKGTPDQFCTALSEVLHEHADVLAEYSVELEVNPEIRNQVMTGRILGPHLGPCTQATALVQLLSVPRHKTLVRFECSPFELRVMGRGLQMLLEGLWERGCLEPPKGSTQQKKAAKPKP